MSGDVRKQARALALELLAAAPDDISMDELRAIAAKAITSCWATDIARAAEARGAERAWDEGFAAGENMAHMWGHVDHWEAPFPPNPYSAERAASEPETRKVWLDDRTYELVAVAPEARSTVVEVLAAHREWTMIDSGISADGEWAWLRCSCGWSENVELPTDDILHAMVVWEAHVASALATQIAAAEQRGREELRAKVEAAVLIAEAKYGIQSSPVAQLRDLLDGGA